MVTANGLQTSEMYRLYYSTIRKHIHPGRVSAAVTSVCYPVGEYGTLPEATEHGAASGRPDDTRIETNLLCPDYSAKQVLKEEILGKLINCHFVIPTHAGTQQEPEFYRLDSGSFPESSPGFGRNDG
jgi:hypothetical protein